MTLVAVRPGSPRARLELRPGALTARVLSVRPDGARVALVGLTALLLGGDHVEIDVEVGPGQRLDLVETAGVVAYDAAGAASSWSTRIRVAAGGRLCWQAEPFVVAEGAAVTRTTEIDLAAGSAARLREKLVLGRAREGAGALTCRTRVSYAGNPLLIEDLDLAEPDSVMRPGMLGTGGRRRIIDQLGCFGTDEPPDLTGLTRFDLDGPGTVFRWMGTSAADSPLSAASVDSTIL